MMRYRRSYRRPHKSRFVEMFGDGKYPEKFLADVSTKITDGTHKTPKYLSTGVRFISAKNIIDGHIDLTNTKFISEDEYQEIQRRCNLELGDVLLTKSGSLGAVAIVDRQERLGLFESLAVIKAKRELVDVCYLKYAIDSPAVQHQFKQGVKGIAIRHLHLNVIARTRIPLPPLALQREFATFVAKVDKLAFAVRKSLESAEKLYRQQLSEAFA